ncbi:MAG: phosphatase PAP2 family protein [Gemmatimonadota bacterium]
MLTDHRRAFTWSLLLLVASVGALFLVGRQAPELAPETSVGAVGQLDASMWRWMGDIRFSPLTTVFHVLNVVGGGLVTIPLRAIGSVTLAIHRRWRALTAFLLTWATSEGTLWALKSYFDRGRPPGGLVETTSSSFPSGHAVAAAATAVAIVLAFLPEGKRRRRWEWTAAIFAFVMAFSRVYLRAHWFSDVVAGTLLGAGIAIFWFAALTEFRDIWRRRHGLPPQRELGDPIVTEL